MKNIRSRNKQKNIFLSFLIFWQHFPPNHPISCVYCNKSVSLLSRVHFPLPMSRDITTFRHRKPFSPFHVASHTALVTVVTSTSPPALCTCIHWCVCPSSRFPPAASQLDPVYGACSPPTPGHRKSRTPRRRELTHARAPFVTPWHTNHGTARKGAARDDFQRGLLRFAQACLLESHRWMLCENVMTYCHVGERGWTPREWMNSRRRVRRTFLVVRRVRVTLTVWVLTTTTAVPVARAAQATVKEFWRTDDDGRNDRRACEPANLANGIRDLL